MSDFRSDTDVWEAVRLNVAALGGKHIKLGVLGQNTPVSGESGITMVELAIIQELGSPAAGVPERSYIRSTLLAKKSEIVAFQGKIVQAVILKRITPEQALNMFGAFMVGLVRATIRNRETTGPEDQANAPSTIAKKGSDTPLIDEGKLIGAISFEVQSGSGGSA